MKNQKKSKQKVMDIIKASRKINRLEEIREHGKTIHHVKIVESKKNYKRSKKHKNELPSDYLD